MSKKKSSFKDRLVFVGVLLLAAAIGGAFVFGAMYKSTQEMTCKELAVDGKNGQTYWYFEGTVLHIVSPISATCLDKLSPGDPYHQEGVSSEPGADPKLQVKGQGPSF